MVRSDDKKSHPAIFFCGCDIRGITCAHLRDKGQKLVLFAPFGALLKNTTGKGSDWEDDARSNEVILHTRNGDHRITVTARS